MKLASNKKALSSGFMTSKSIRRTAAVPYLFIHGFRFMLLVLSANDESKEGPVQVALEVLSGRENIARHECPLTGDHFWGADDRVGRNRTHFRILARARVKPRLSDERIAELV
jgi:hypothetical protein